MKKYIKFLPIALILAYTAYVGIKYYIDYAGIKGGEMAPNFEAKTIDGTTFQLTDLRGKYVLIEFWGSWCGPCIKKIPELVALSNKNYPNLEIMSIALEKSGDRWEKVAQKYNMDWKYQVVEYNTLIMMSSIARDFGISEIPAAVLVSPKGRIIPYEQFIDIDEIVNK